MNIDYFDPKTPIMLKALSRKATPDILSILKRQPATVREISEITGLKAPEIYLIVRELTLAGILERIGKKFRVAVEELTVRI